MQKSHRSWIPVVLRRLTHSVLKASYPKYSNVSLLNRFQISLAGYNYSEDRILELIKPGMQHMHRKNLLEKLCVKNSNFSCNSF